MIREIGNQGDRSLVRREDSMGYLGWTFSWFLLGTVSAGAWLKRQAGREDQLTLKDLVAAGLMFVSGPLILLCLAVFFLLSDDMDVVIWRRK
jgi:hypothetical protein